MPALAAASALLLTLTACVPPADVVVPVEPSHAQPVFASDEEALAAAVEVFEEYQEVVYNTDDLGVPDFDELSELVTDEWLEVERQGFENNAQSGLRLEGVATQTNRLLQQWWEDPPGVANVIVYFCEDQSSVRVVSESGQDVTPVSREDIVPIEVYFVGISTGSKTLRIAEVGPWAGSGLC